MNDGIDTCLIRGCKEGPSGSGAPTFAGQHREKRKGKHVFVPEAESPRGGGRGRWCLGIPGP